MIRTWARIERWLENNFPDLLESLNPPAKESDLRNLESMIGVSLPESVRQSYLIHNGQSAEPTGLFFGEILMPLSDILDRWDELDCIEEINENLDIQESTPSNFIKSVRFSSKWIPISDGAGGGSFIGIDQDPGPSGKAGQILNFGVRDYENFVLADSFEAFMEKFADSLEREPFEINQLREFSMPDPNKLHHSLHFIEYLTRKMYGK